MKNQIILSIIILVLSSSCVTKESLRLANQKIGDTNSELSKSNKFVRQLNDSMNYLHQQLDGVYKKNNQCQVELVDVRNSKEIIDQHFPELDGCLNEHDDSLQNIQRKALRDFSTFDQSFIDVEYRNGMLYISLKDEFIFKSGSSIINSGGKKALSVIAKILSENEFVTAIVAGNKDSINAEEGYKENWSLSAKRAKSIVLYLLSNYGADPNRLFAVGKRSFNAVASNTNEHGRTKDRRTDIIIDPDLKELWLLSQKYP
jgi:chemotaxis protein MotB